VRKHRVLIGGEREGKERKERKRRERKREKRREKDYFPQPYFHPLSFRAASSIRYTIELPNNKRGSRLKMQVIMKLSALYLLLLTSY
jgi:hypothetical protein